MFGKIVRSIERAFRWITTVLFILMLVAVLVQIVARYALPSAPVWTEEMTRFALIFMTAFACGTAVRGRELVNVDMFVNMMPHGVRRVAYTLVDVITLVFGATFFYYSIEYVERSAMQQATTLPIQMSWITMSVLMIAASLCLFTAVNLVDDFTGREEKSQ